MNVHARFKKPCIWHTPFGTTAFMAAKQLIKGLWLRGNTYWFRLMRHGKRHVWNLFTDDLSLAIERAAEKRRNIDAEPVDLVERELKAAIAAKLSANTIRQKTATGMESTVKIFCEWAGPVSAATITPEKAAEFLKYLRDKKHGRGMKEAGVQSYVRSLRSCFSWLEEKKRIMASPFKKIALPKLSKSPRRDFYSREVRDDLIADAPDDDLKLILLLGMHAGLRKIEIAEARPEWIDLGQMVIHVSKTDTYTPKDSEDRTIPLSKPLVAHFRKHGIGSPFLIRPDVKHGKSEYRYDFRVPFEVYGAAKGIKLSSHKMRRTFASLLIQRGVSIYKVAKWLGDAVAVVEESYGHLKAYDSEID